MILRVCYLFNIKKRFVVFDIKKKSLFEIKKRFAVFEIKKRFGVCYAVGIPIFKKQK